MEGKYSYGNTYMEIEAFRQGSYTYRFRIPESAVRALTEWCAIQEETIQKWIDGGTIKKRALYEKSDSED